jgi:hypothetical protein
MDKINRPHRRTFLYCLAACGAATFALEPWMQRGFAAEVLSRKGSPYMPLNDGLPAKPMEEPLDWKSIADAFDAYIMDSGNHVLIQRPDGKPGFVSALEGTTDGGLTTFAPILLGKILRGDDVAQLIPSLEGYFSIEAGIFLDGVGADLCEYWYLMNINALASGIVRSKLPNDAEWTARLRSSFERMISLAHQIQYDFNDHGYNFKEHQAFTKKDIYRQPDAIAGYSYLMLLAFDMFGDKKFLAEAKIAVSRYQSFSHNPWYEVPSGAMGTLAAARLSAFDPSVDIHKILGFVLDPNIGLMRTGSWGGKEVNGLMSGFSTEPPDEAYSMESMVALPYLLPVLRYRPEYANDIGRYALNTLANLRWFYSDHLPLDQQDRPELSAAFPYERLDKSAKGKSPYATGDYESHRSVYGGAYAMWLGQIVMPTTDKYILQIDISRTDFLTRRTYPTYLYYNPWDGERSVVMDVGNEKMDIYDLGAHRLLHKGVTGSVPVPLHASESRILVVIPSGRKRTTKDHILYFGGIAVDYAVAGS